MGVWKKNKNQNVYFWKKTILKITNLEKIQFQTQDISKKGKFEKKMKAITKNIFEKRQS